MTTTHIIKAFSLAQLFVLTVAAGSVQTAEPLPGIGIMYLTKSDSVENGPQDLSKSPAWKNSLVQGVALRTQWSKIEPTEGKFDWSYLDEGMKLAAIHKKKVSVLITAGVTTPDWVYTAGATKFMVTRVAGPVAPMPLPWDPVFQAKWRNVIRAFAARYAKNPQLVYVVMGGPGRKAESYFVATAKDQTAVNALGGLKSWKSGVEWIIDEYAKSFPDISFLLDLGAPYPTVDGQAALKDVADYGAKKYPAHFAVKSDGLATNYRLSSFGATEVKLLSPTSMAGFQMTLPTKGKRGANGNLLLADALEIGINLGARFVEVYSVDCDDPVHADVLRKAAPRLIAPKP